MRAHPVQNAIFKSLEDDSINKDTFIVEKLPSTVMALTLDMYITNFKNMWNNKKIINKLLDKLLIVLLRLHLAPNRESIRQQIISNRPKKSNEKRLSKNYARYILRSEKKKLQKHQKKMKVAELGLERGKLSVTVEKAEVRILKLKEKFLEVN